MRIRRIITGVLTMALLAACTGFGGEITGHRKDRVSSSPNNVNGSFKNLDPESNESEISLGMIWDFYFGGQKDRVPMVAPEIVESRFSESASQDLKATWFGHSSVMLELERKYILIDPVFSRRASPFSVVGPKRFHPSPISANDDSRRRDTGETPATSSRSQGTDDKPNGNGPAPHVADEERAPCFAGRARLA